MRPPSSDVMCVATVGDRGHCDLLPYIYIDIQISLATLPFLFSREAATEEPAEVVQKRNPDSCSARADVPLGRTLQEEPVDHTGDTAPSSFSCLGMAEKPREKTTPSSGQRLALEGETSDPTLVTSQDCHGADPCVELTDSDDDDELWALGDQRWLSELGHCMLQFTLL